jgi:hypothetical protein
VELAVGEFGHRGDLGLPGAGEFRLVHFLPVGLRHPGERDGDALHRAQEPHPPFDLAIVEHQARCRYLNGGAARLAVDEQPCARIIGVFQRLLEGERMVAVAALDAEHLRFRAASGVNVESAAIRDDEAFGRDGLHRPRRRCRW